MELYCRDSHGTLLNASLPRLELLSFLGYKMDCFVLPNTFESRPIWGLKGVLIKTDGFGLTIFFEPKR